MRGRRTRNVVPSRSDEVTEIDPLSFGTRIGGASTRSHPQQGRIRCICSHKRSATIRTRGAARPQRRSEAPFVGLAVASHFVLDLVVHVPHLPVAGTAGLMLGFGLWRHRELALLVECTLFVLAALFWRRVRENRGARGAIVLSAMTALLVTSYYLPAMPTPASMAVTGFLTYGACALGAWWAVPSPMGRRRGARATRSQADTARADGAKSGPDTRTVGCRHCRTAAGSALA